MPLLSRRPSRPSRSLTASAQRVTRDNATETRRVQQNWQERAIEKYQTLGEIWFAGQFFARPLSKLRLFAAELDDDGNPQPSENAQLIELWDRVEDPGGGRSVMTGNYGRLRFLTGECFLVCTLDEDAVEQWEILSMAELKVLGDGSYTRRRGPGLKLEELKRAPDGMEGPGEGEALVYRFWQRDPIWSQLADSSMRGVLDLCDELTLLTRAVRARALSRLSGPGILLVSEEISPPPADAQPDEDPMNYPFFRDLFNTITSSISDPGSAAAAVPHVLCVRHDLVQDGMKLIKFGDPAEEYQEQGQRKECVDRISVGLDFPIEYLQGITDANHWCVDTETEILTRDRGWVGHEGLAIGDVVRTLDHETGLAEWQPVLDIYRADVVEEPMRKLESRTHSSLTTRAHRWPVLRERWDNKRRYMAREWATSAELVQQHTIITGAFSADGPVSAMHSDDLVEIAAWFWTEGHMRGKVEKSILIAQSHTHNPERVARIRGSLTRLFGPARESLRALDHPAWRESIQANESSHGGPITLFNLNRHASAAVLEVVPEKRLDPRFLCSLTRAQLDLFIDVSCQGDGHHYAAGELDLWQRDPGALDGYELAVVLSGRAASRQPSHDDGTVVRALRSLGVRPVKAAEEASRIGNDAGATDEIVAYTGTIWCPTTANRTWLARRGGRTFFTGNSAWLVDEQTWKAHQMPVAQAMVEDFTSAYLRPAAIAAGIPNADRVVVAYDAAEVINHPDRAKDAKDLHDRISISDRSLRDAAGFDEDDAPSQEERAERIGIKVRDASLAWYGIPGIRTGGIEPAPGEIVTGQGTDKGATGPTTGAEVIPGPPAEPSPVRTASAAPVDAVALVHVAQLRGAAEAAVERARELAGSRLRTKAKACGDCQTLIDGADNGVVAHLLGPEQVRALDVGSERDLVHGSTRPFAATVARFGVAPDWAAELADLVETHAARTLYELEAPPLPGAFAALARRAAPAPDEELVPA